MTIRPAGEAVLLSTMPLVVGSVDVMLRNSKSSVATEPMSVFVTLSAVPVVVLIVFALPVTLRMPLLVATSP